MKMAIRKIKSAQARDILGQIMEESYYKGNDFIIEKGSKPMVVIIPFQEYQRIRKEREDDFTVFEEVWDRNKDIKLEDIENDIKDAINEVRSSTLMKNRKK